MPAAGRVGDQAQCPADSHGCPGCAHGVIGPAVKGSPNVFVNGRAALRIGDPGVHAACCGPNTWKAGKGSDTVFVNGIAFHRKDDQTIHCGGSGKLVDGSPDVDIGGKGPDKMPMFDQAFVLKDETTGEPVANRRYRIKRAGGSVIEGKTDDEGRTILIMSDEEETLDIEVMGEDEEGGDDW
ncbi:MAG: PAAR domain-containing protein [Deltaproteobacteria bacterium]|nr:PAAR domain-containing protein [Deltaproteobacteria bacterium]